MTPKARAMLERAVAGAAAGLVGGVAMEIFLVLDAGGLGMGLSAPLLYVAAVLLGPRALVGSVGVVLLGLLIHFVVAMLWGALFALVVPDLGTGPSVAYGLGAALVVLVVMTFAVLPIANPTMAVRIRLFWGSWVFAHALFGFGLSAAPLLRRKLWRAPGAAAA